MKTSDWRTSLITYNVEQFGYKLFNGPIYSAAKKTKTASDSTNFHRLTN